MNLGPSKVKAGLLTAYVTAYVCILLLLLLLLLTAIGLSPGGSGYFTRTQIWGEEKLTRKFKSGGLHERHVVATWKLGKHLSILL